MCPASIRRLRFLLNNLDALSFTGHVSVENRLYFSF